MNDFLGVLMHWHGLVPPPGCAYSYHSIRHMAASSMKAIGVADQRVKMMGNWADMVTADKKYVDPACTDTYGCYRLYGHLLPAADRLVSVARRPADMRSW